MARKELVAHRLLDMIEVVSPKAEDEHLLGHRDGLPWEEMGDLPKPSAFNELGACPLPVSVKAAFELAGMDRTNPAHWLQLMFLFAWAHFGDRAKRGAPKKWDTAKYRKLIGDFNEIKGRRPNLSDEAIFKQLAKQSDYLTKKGPLSSNCLRKLLKEANGTSTVLRWTVWYPCRPDDAGLRELLRDLFKDHLRDELLNETLFRSLPQACLKDVGEDERHRRAGARRLSHRRMPCSVDRGRAWLAVHAADPMIDENNHRRYRPTTSWMMVRARCASSAAHRASVRTRRS